MGYTRKWVPPTIPFRDDLAAWKTIFQDVHDNLVMIPQIVQTADTGQLDISAVAALPDDGSYAGYRIYRFADALQATMPIFIKLEFGCGMEGYWAGSQTRSRTLNIRVSIGKGTNGAGVISSLIDPITYTCPQPMTGQNPTVSTQLTAPGESYACFNEAAGFFGFFYGVGSRNVPFSGSGGQYIGCTLGIMIQRTTDDNGVATGEGASILHQQNIATNVADPRSEATFVNHLLYIRSASNDVMRSRRAAYRNFANLATPIDGVPQLHPVFTCTPRIRQLTGVLSYRSTDIGRGIEFQAEIIPGQVRNYIALSSDNFLYPDPTTLATSAFAMLFE